MEDLFTNKERLWLLNKANSLGQFRVKSINHGENFDNSTIKFYKTVSTINKKNILLTINQN